MRFCLLSCLVFSVYGDKTIVLDREQLRQAQMEVEKQGNTAINKIPETQKQLAQIRFGNLDVESAHKQLEELRGNEAWRAKPLTNKLPSGEKYYLYSESILSDAQDYVKQERMENRLPLDIDQTIRDYNAMLKHENTKLATNRLLVFISSSMPKKTLVNLMTQGSSIGAVFIVRGLIQGSYVKTYKYFYSLKGDNTVGIMINPTLFKALDVNMVPTFALYKSSQDLMQTACSVAPEYVKVSGNIPVHYALEQLKLAKDSDLAQIANNELHILDKSSFYHE